MQCIHMERKDRTLNLRVSERQRAVYERAAAVAGISVAALLTSAADDLADDLLRRHASTTVPTDVFDDLLASLDRPVALPPALAKAFAEPRFVNR